MAIDVSKLSEKELRKLQKSVEKALSAHDRQKRTEAKKAAEAAAKKHGFALSELVGNSTAAPRSKPRPAGKKAAVPPKYRNPDDASQTWSGRGRQPGWYKDAVAKGTDPKSLEI